MEDGARPINIGEDGQRKRRAGGLIGMVVVGAGTMILAVLDVGPVVRLMMLLPFNFSALALLQAKEKT